MAKFLNTGATNYYLGEQQRDWHPRGLRAGARAIPRHLRGSPAPDPYQRRGSACGGQGGPRSGQRAR
jgi:hypothetical protein